MLKCPQFKPHLQVEVHKGDGVFIVSEINQTVLQGRLYETVVPWLDGRPVEEVCQQLRGVVEPMHVFYTVNELERQGVLYDDATEPAAGQSNHDPQTSLWSLQGVSPLVAAKRLARATVSVCGLDIETQSLEQMLGAIGVRVVPNGDLHVVLADDYLDPKLVSINQQALTDGKPWILIKPTGALIWVGPLFLPNETGCWECLASRMRANFPILDYMKSHPVARDAATRDRAWSVATLSVAWGLAANCIAMLMVNDASRCMLAGRIHTLNLLTWHMESHALQKQPACSACGNECLRSDCLPEAQPLQLKSCKKTFTADGGHRALSPQETIDKYAQHISPICGAVSQLQKASGIGHEVMHVYVSGNNTARGPQSIHHLKTDLRHLSAGKGTSDVQAKASALCEALERYSGVFRGDEPRRLNRLVDFEEDAIHPNACMLFSQRQYEERETRNRNCSVYDFIPQPFDPERVIEWTPVWSLSQQRTRYLPTAFCYFKYPTPADAYSCVGCSNGNAAGNSLEEAVFQGFLELAERDGVALWWYNRLRVPGVDLDSLDDPYLEKLRAYLSSQNREMWVLDVTSDLGIPTCVAVSRRTHGPSEQIMLGFGAHLDPRIAILRAVTELNQMLMPLIQYSDENLPGILSDPDTLRWLNSATVAEQTYLLPQQSAPTTVDTYPYQWGDDIRDDVKYCQALVESRNLEMLVLDQTRPEIGMPVVKVIVPGLRHFWSRYAPGRLYNVPVQTGQLPNPLSESQLNPISMFM